MNNSSYQFTSVILQSERITVDVELRDVVTDLDIFEHLDKPYLTGKILLIDNENFLQESDLLGGEKIIVTVKSFREETSAITKTFYISKISATEKAQDNVQVIGLDLIEDISFISNLQVVNRSYLGRISEILNKISFNYLNNKPITTSNTDFDSIKVIIPNLEPLHAFKWLCNRAKTNDGYPFYLYSTFARNELQFFDLGTLLKTSVINPNVPYRQNSAAARSYEPDIRRRTMLTHQFASGAELLELIQKALIGANYEYIDTTLESRKSFHYDIMKDLFKPLLAKNVLQQNQPNPQFSAEYKLNGKSFNKLSSAQLTMIGGNNAYRTTDDINYIKGYNEERNVANYKAKIISQAMDSILRTEPLSMVVDGVDFLDGDKHSTIGNQLRVEFSISNPEPNSDADRIDKRKSGDYLIFAARHMFKKEKYDLALSCVKLGNYRRNDT